MSKTQTKPTPPRVETMAYSFAALRGIQAGRSYFSIMCPLQLIPRILVIDEEELSPELRAQRVLNPSRVPGIARYLVDNANDYVLPPIIASIAAEVRFEASEGNHNIGTLHVPMSATILVNDGQHRRAAIIRAIKERPELASESLSVVLFIDAGLKRSQQLFSDLNFHGAKPAKSLGVLYDHRDAMADLARDLATRNPTFRGLTEMEKPSIGKASRKLFTIGAIHQATQALLGIGRKGSPTKQQAALAHRFWEEVGNCIPDWSRARLGQVQSAELRQDTVHAHAVALQALGVAGEALVSEHSDWEGRLQPLEDVNWLRSAPHWEGKALTGGVVQKTSAHVTATANYLKGVLGLEVS